MKKVLIAGFAGMLFSSLAMAEGAVKSTSLEGNAIVKSEVSVDQKAYKHKGKRGCKDRAEFDKKRDELFTAKFNKIAEVLELTEEQKSQALAIVNEEKKQSIEKHAEFKGKVKELRAEYKKDQKASFGKVREKTMDLLSEEQKVKAKEYYAEKRKEFRENMSKKSADRVSLSQESLKES